MNVDDLNSVPGWFWPSDVKLFNWFLRNQILNATPGDLAELGPYLGKSAIVIGSHLQADEIFTVVDLFESISGDVSNQKENVETYGGLRQAEFEHNYRRFHGRLPVVIRGDSGEIAAHAKHGAHRFVHVDASHMYALVRDDIATVKTLLRPDGIVAFDDIRAVHTPGVWAAVWEAVISGGLIPIVVTEHKMYATWGKHLEWQERLSAFGPEALLIEEQSVLGRTLLRAWTPDQRTTPSTGRHCAEAILPPALLYRLDRLAILAASHARSWSERLSWRG